MSQQFWTHAMGIIALTILYVGCLPDFPDARCFVVSFALGTAAAIWEFA